jgi:hypothetical protein
LRKRDVDVEREEGDRVDGSGVCELVSLHGSLFALVGLPLVLRLGGALFVIEEMNLAAHSVVEHNFDDFSVTTVYFKLVQFLGLSRTANCSRCFYVWKVMLHKSLCSQLRVGGSPSVCYIAVRLLSATGTTDPRGARYQWSWSRRIGVRAESYPQNEDLIDFSAQDHDQAAPRHAIIHWVSSRNTKSSAMQTCRREDDPAVAMQLGNKPIIFPPRIL